MKPIICSARPFRAPPKVASPESIASAGGHRFRARRRAYHPAGRRIPPGVRAGLDLTAALVAVLSRQASARYGGRTKANSAPSATLRQVPR
jgi:hypothetical protein